LKDTQHVTQAYRLEFRNLPPAEREEYTAKLQQHRRDINQIKNDLEWAKQKDIRNELLDAPGRGRM
jgi:Vesicle transport v-SNARE protein N-terminus